jgi:hypothetical protein
MLKEIVNQGNKCIVLNIFESGSQHVDHIENQYVGNLKPNNPLLTSPRGGKNDLPEVLATEEAMKIWQKVQDAGYIDTHYQPLLSRTQSALLADAIAVKLGIRQKWKTFETLWNRKNMYRDYYQALDQRKTLFFRDEIKKVLA